MDMQQEPAPDEGGITFDMPPDEEALKAPPKRNYTQDANLVLQLTPDEQLMLSKDVAECYERDWKSGEKFRKRRVRQVELFAGIMPEKPPGHEKIAQIHLSIIAQSVLILHATIHGQLFPPTNNIYGARAVTPAAYQRVERLGRHINWQVTTRIPEYLPAVDRGMMQWLIYGTMFDCWYYDPIEQRPCYEVIQTDDLVMPYSSKSVRYDLADVPRKTRKLRKYQHEVERLRDARGFWVNVEKLWPEDKPDGDMLAPEKVGDDQKPMQKSQDRIQGQEEPEDPHGPRLFLEQHRWYTLPGEKSQRPVIVTQDYDTRTIVRLVLREDEDPRDRSRYDREVEAREAQVQALTAQHQQAMDEYGMTMQAAQQPPQGPPPPQGAPSPMDGAPPAPPAPPQPGPDMSAIQPPEPPQMPELPVSIRMVPVEWFTKYGCIPNPEGIYDFGVGYLLEGDNIAADTLMSQYVSALTLSLFPTFLYSKQAKMQRGDLKLRMGDGIEVPLPPDMLQKAFYQFQFPPPPNAVQKLIEQREESGRQLVGASNILTGEGATTNETLGSVQIRNNAARMNLAEMGNRFNNARGNSMKNLARLNAKTLDPVEYFSVTLPGQQMQPPGEPESIAREDYLEDFQITFQCDPRLASQPQRVQDALALLTQLLQIPPGSINMQAQQAAITMALVGYLRALDRDDMANLIEQAGPPQPPQPPTGAGPNGPGAGASGGQPGGPQPGNVGGPPGGASPHVGHPAGNPNVPPPNGGGPPGGPGGNAGPMHP